MNEGLGKKALVSYIIFKNDIIWDCYVVIVQGAHNYIIFA